MTDKSDERLSAVVIGGGISGLASAALLAKAGMKVTLLEGSDRLGGRARIWESSGFRFDMGPSWYLMPDAFDQFFRLMGTTVDAELKLERLDPAYLTINEGHGDRLLIREGLDANKALFEELEPGASTTLQAYLDSAEDAYRLAKEHFLYTNFENANSFFHPEVMKRAGRFIKHLLTPLDRFAGKHVKNPRLRKILNFPAVFLGASPYETPSMYHLMTHIDMNVGVFYPMGGLHTIIEAVERLAKQHGVQIHVSSPVSRIEVDESSRARGVWVTDVFFPADVVIGTADLHHIETKLLDEKHQSLPEKWWKDKVPGPSAMLLYLGVRRIPQLEHHTLLYADDWDKNFDEVFHPADGKRQVPNPASLYICAPSRSDDTVAPVDHENLFVLVPIAADPSIGSGGVDRGGDAAFEAEADRVIQQIADWCEIPDLAERIVVRRTMGPGNFVSELNAWSGTALGMAHTLGQSAFFRPKNYSRKVKGLYYAGHNTIPGIGLPMCLIGAELVYKRMIGDKSSGPTPGEIKPLGREAWRGLT